MRRRVKRSVKTVILVVIGVGAIVSVAPLTWREAEDETMRGWYAETWYTRAAPADRYEGEAQLKYFRAKTPHCKRAADGYHLTGKDRWFAFMRCLVIVRKR